MTKRTTGLTGIAALVCLSGTAAFAQVAPASQTAEQNKPAAGVPQAATSASGGQTPVLQPPAAASAAPVALTPTRIVVIAVNKTARYQLTPNGPQALAKVGAVLAEGVKIGLGLGSSITLRIGDSQDLTFDQLGSFVITEAVNDGVTDITRIDLSRGRVQFDVNKVRFANDVVIQTPDMTLAIKGTQGAIEHVAGQPTRAFGDMRNRGRIELDHRMTGRKVVMTRNEQSSTAIPDPAANLAMAAVVDASTEGARESDEIRVLKRTEGASKQAVTLDVGDTNAGGMRIDLTPTLNLRPPVTGGTGGVNVGPGTIVQPRVSGRFDITNDNINIHQLPTRSNFAAADMVTISERFALMTYRADSIGLGSLTRVVRAQAINHINNPTIVTLPAGITDAGVHSVNVGASVLNGTVNGAVIEQAEIGRSIYELRIHPEPLNVYLPTSKDN